MNYLIIDKIIKDALLEDGVYEDITVLSVVPEGRHASVELIAKEDGIICGLDVFKRVFDIMGDVKVDFYFGEGDHVKKGDLLAELHGLATKLLSGERVALNLLQHMSGIATYTNKIANLLHDSNIKIFDTRKTTPNLRYLEKYSVKIGGGYNHRYNLSDMAMIKDNHILAAGSITKAVQAVKNNYPFVKNVEVETENLTQVKEAVNAKADIIMLDNMDYDTMKKAIEIIDGQAIVEASGNMTLEKIESLKTLKVDYFSSGALTHSVQALDISMKNLKLLD